MSPARRISIVIVAACWILTTTASAQSPPLQSVTLFNNSDLTAWEKVDTDAVAHDGVLSVSAGKGWLRSARRHSDFALHLDVRLTGDRAQGSIYIRAYAKSKSSERPPDNGYEIEVRADTTARMHDLSRDVWFPLGAAPGGAKPTAPVSDGWHHYDIGFRQPVLRVSIDGVEVLRLTDLMNPSGYLGLAARRGTLDVRNVMLEIEKIVGVEKPGDIVEKDANGNPPPGVINASVRQRVEPEYNALALARRMSGVVVVEAVIGTDGKAYDVVVMRPLDPISGLDASAIASMRQSTFNPATRDGHPVPIRFTFAVTFQLH